MRVLDKETADLKPLPQGTNPLGIPVTPSSVFPPDAAVKNFNVVPLDRPMKLHPKAPDVIEVDFEHKIEMTMPESKIYALEEGSDHGGGQCDAEPAHVACRLGRLHQGPSQEQMKASWASFFAPGLAFDPKDS
ncbi:MAG: hypothetical protein ABI988_20900 [Nitrospirota bacterium]